VVRRAIAVERAFSALPAVVRAGAPFRAREPADGAEAPVRAAVPLRAREPDRAAAGLRFGVEGVSAMPVQRYRLERMFVNPTVTISLQSERLFARKLRVSAHEARRRPSAPEIRRPAA
jgi:hypothetical protein